MLKIMKLTLALFVVLFFSSCKKECENPCKDKAEVSANFKVYEVLWGEPPKDPPFYEPYATDTIWTKGRFVADEEGASYTWLIGAGVYNTKEVTLDFPSSLIGSSVPVTLIVEKTPNKECFPNDDGRDTFTKRVFLKNKQDFKGTFQAPDPEDPNKIWTFEFKNDTAKVNPQGFGFWNIPKGFFEKPVFINAIIYGGRMQKVISYNYLTKWAQVKMTLVKGNQYDCQMVYGYKNSNGTKNLSTSSKMYSFIATKIN
jgi:hypothetical protein